MIRHRLAPPVGRNPSFVTAMLVPIAMLMAACDPLSMTMLGVGASAGINHQIGGIVYKTFTEPGPKVRRATLAALKRMAIKVESVEKYGNVETLKAKAGDRVIEIEIETLTATTTRMRAVARQDGSLFVDSATAVEIIGQTERQLG